MTSSGAWSLFKNIKGGIAVNSLKPSQACRTLARQRGVFAIEMAFIMVFLCAIFLFVSDISMQLLQRVSLDRTSYTLVNVLKERRRFYANEEGVVRLSLSQTDHQQMAQIAQRMLGADANAFHLTTESLVGGRHQQYQSANNINCPVAILTPSSPLIPYNLDNEPLPMYQVTVCMQRESWFSRFFNSSSTQTLHSTSAIVGR
ncbi:tight adherence pilus pseudopilin TadF [Photobacterium sanctipauli]|uniref:tight adherence pilus pseudopilin TadF n=1 Tax=Photobacterium sanctipauli TaxID=1342794 RepID=UPI001FEA99B1|nr:tight adherence pilus pseudopilin TadF [Photobacterium sanctipauli]